MIVSCLDLQRPQSVPLRGGAAVPSVFAAGWPTLDGRTLSDSFLATVSKADAKLVSVSCKHMSW